MARKVKVYCPHCSGRGIMYTLEESPNTGYICSFCGGSAIERGEKFHGRRAWSKEARKLDVVKCHLCRKTVSYHQFRRGKYPCSCMVATRKALTR